MEAIAENTGGCRLRDWAYNWYAVSWDRRWKSRRMELISSSGGLEQDNGLNLFDSIVTYFRHPGVCFVIIEGSIIEIV